MNSFALSWNRLTAAVRSAADREPAPGAEPAWVTRVAALGVEAIRRQLGQPAWLTWALPGFGVATVVAVVTVVVGASFMHTSGSAELVALADPLAGGSLLP